VVTQKNHKKYVLGVLLALGFGLNPSLASPVPERGLTGLNLKGLHNPVWVSKDNLRDPSVLKTDAGYLLFYSRFRAEQGGWNIPKNWAIGCVFTKDFVHFENDRDVSPPGCASPGDVVRWHGRWLLPYQTYPGKPTQLVFAESANLQTWSAPKPFLTEAMNLPWNELHRVIDPSFVVDGDTLHCFFIGSAYRRNANGQTVRGNLMGHAITRNMDLKKWKILTPDAPLIGFSEQAPDGVENTMIFRTGDHWTMIYSEGLAAQHLALATSPDLIKWNLAGPIELSRQEWMAHRYGAPYVWRDSSQWLMILMGENAAGRTTFGLLTSSDGEHWKLLPDREAKQSYGL
jgi:sucrose-6-phosphate hydrolase SacC (GH32 family)